MSKRNTKKKNEQMIKYECNYLSEDRMIEIHAQAYYKALKRIEQEKEEVKEQITCKKENKAIDNILFWLNLGVCPFKISKRFKLNKNAYEGILVAPISSLLECIGALIWLLGIATIAYSAIEIIKLGFSLNWLLAMGIKIVLVLWGSIFYISGKTFGQERDSNKIYAYSASVIAMISCIVSLISLLK